MLITSTCDAFTISAARVLIAGEVVEYGLQNAFLCSVLLLWSVVVTVFRHGRTGILTQNKVLYLH